MELNKKTNKQKGHVGLTEKKKPHCVFGLNMKNKGSWMEACCAGTNSSTVYGTNRAAPLSKLNTIASRLVERSGGVERKKSGGGATGFPPRCPFCLH